MFQGSIETSGLKTQVPHAEVRHRTGITSFLKCVEETTSKYLHLPSLDLLADASGPSPTHHARTSPQSCVRPPAHPQCRQRVLPLPLQRHLLLPIPSRILPPLRPPVNPVDRDLHCYPRASIHLCVRSASIVPLDLPRPDSMV